MAKSNDKKSTIPNQILKDFLEEKIQLSKMHNVLQIVDGFLWEQAGVERYRINVWKKESVEGYYCDRVYISNSWFVHFDRAKKLIVDKTVAPKPKDE